MNQTDVLMMLADQARGRRSFDSENALALLCREIAQLDPSVPDYAQRLGALIEIGVTIWHLRDVELRR
jgi:hypothetical protein